MGTCLSPSGRINSRWDPHGIEMIGRRRGLICHRKGNGYLAFAPQTHLFREHPDHQEKSFEAAKDTTLAAGSPDTMVRRLLWSRRSRATSPASPLGPWRSPEKEPWSYFAS